MMSRSVIGYIVPFAALILAAGACNAYLNPPAADVVQADAPAIIVAPSASATMMHTATPDALATTAASSAATNSEAQASIGDTQSANSTNTAIAETQTPRAWTQSAIDMQQRIDVAGANEAEAKAFMAWITVTMLPTALTETEAAKWLTAAAEQTAVEDRRIAAGRAQFFADLSGEAWGWLQVAVPVLMILFLIAVAYLGANALIKNLEAPTWVRQAQALSIAGTEAIPGKKGGKPHELIRDADRAALVAFVAECRKKSGDGSTTITPQSQFASDAGWSEAVKALTYHGLVTTKPGKGGGTRIADGMTLEELEQVLRKGSEG